MKIYEKYLLESKKLVIYPDGLRECCDNTNGLNNCLKKLFPNNTFVHDKFIKVNNNYITNICGQKIRPDYFCESLKIVVEYDGYQHYTDPFVILKDKYNTEALRSVGYTVIRIPFYVQLDKYAIKHYFNIDFNNLLYDTCSDHGFIHPKATLPSQFCEHGIDKFNNDLCVLPKEVTNSIVNSLLYRLTYCRTQLNCYDDSLVIPLSTYNTIKKSSE